MWAAAAGRAPAPARECTVRPVGTSPGRSAGRGEENIEESSCTAAKQVLALGSALKCKMQTGADWSRTFI